ncbi:MAG: hypothetical protein ACYC8T_09675, partial [Myxococcaceae bacterium]
MDAADRRAPSLRLPALVMLLFAVMAGGLGCSKRNEEGTRQPAVAVALGSEGGSIDVPLATGKLTVVVPPGAIDEVVQFTARVVENAPPGAVGPVVELGPHGTTFRQPVTLRFIPDLANLPRDISFVALRAAHYSGGHWQVLPAGASEPGKIEGLTRHFSVFGLVEPCRVSGVGTDFPLSGCETVNPRIQTSAPVS